MKRTLRPLLIPLLAAPLICQAANCNDTLSPDTPIEPVGYYTNPASDLVKNRTPFIYFVQLWRAGECHFGEFAVNNGMDGEGKTGFIDGFTYDPKTRNAHFSAKLRIGAGTKDFFEYSGQFEPKRFNGTITYTDQSGNNPAVATKVKLSLSKDTREAMKLEGGKNTYGAWRNGSRYGRPAW